MKSKRNKHCSEEKITKRAGSMYPEKTSYEISPAFSALTDVKLIKKFPHPPKNEDLITPINRLLPVDLSAGAVNLCVLDDDAADAIRYALHGNFFAMATEQEKDFLFELESGNFETIARTGKSNLWQRLWLRYRIWQMRRKIRKELRRI